MPSKTKDLPQIVFLARDGATLSDLQACAGKLWLGEDRSEDGGKSDHDGAVRKAVDAHWNESTGDDPYWAFLATRGACRHCRETYKHENLTVCPNCFNTYCYREPRACDCGHRALG